LAEELLPNCQALAIDSDRLIGVFEQGIKGSYFLKKVYKILTLAQVIFLIKPQALIIVG
jgi:hypothetical protein